MAGHKMLAFVGVGKETAFKRSARLRPDDFREMQVEYHTVKAAERTGRCSRLGAPYCQTHCPPRHSIPGGLRLANAGCAGRLRTQPATNAFSEIRSRFCPLVRFCE